MAYLAFELYLLFIIVWRVPFREAGFTSAIDPSISINPQLPVLVCFSKSLALHPEEYRRRRVISRSSEDWSVGIRTADSGLG